MARKKKAKRRGHNKSSIEKEYYEEIEFHCPTRGLIKQKVKVTKLKSKLIDPYQMMGGGDELDSLEEVNEEEEISDED